PPMNLLAKLILKDFRVSFLYFFIQKRCWRTSPTSKSIEPISSAESFLSSKNEKNHQLKYLSKRI
ncbi:hypothetical protein, partial [Enterococcus durans]|uniref:hypothetical protein n=1 Tax=Enterococcus durans TaxID=53345 RepID=UPI001C8DDDA4